MEINPYKYYKLFISMKLMDEASILSDQLFMHQKNDPKAIFKRFINVIDSKKDSIAKERIIYAYINACFNAFFQIGERKNAKYLIDRSCLENNAFNNLDTNLRKIGGSYGYTCVSANKFLCPNDLDKFIFEKHAPTSIDVCNFYPGMQGLALAKERKDGTTNVNFINDRSSCEALFNLEGRLERAVYYVKMEMKKKNYNGPIENNYQRIVEQFQDDGIKDFRIIRTITPNLKSYITNRFMIKRIGNLLDRYDGGLLADLNFNKNRD